jgi:hypothetical protein
LAKAKPLAPVNAIDGTRINRPGHTIKRFTVDMNSTEPKSSTNTVAEKNVAMQAMAIAAANRWTMSIRVSSKKHDW